MKAVDSQREIGVFAVDAHVVPGQVVETQPTRGGHLRFAGSQVDPHLQRRRLQHHQAIVGPSGRQEKKSVRSRRPEPEAQIRRRAGLLQRQGDVTRSVKRSCQMKQNKLELDLTDTINQSAE